MVNRRKGHFGVTLKKEEEVTQYQRKDERALEGEDTNYEGHDLTDNSYRTSSRQHCREVKTIYFVGTINLNQTRTGGTTR